MYAVEMALYGTLWHGFGGGLSQKAVPHRKLGQYYREVGTLSPGAHKKTSRKSQGSSRPVQTKRASNRRKRRQRSVRTQAKAAARNGTENPKSSQTGPGSCSYHTHTHTRTRFQPSHDSRRSKSRSRSTSTIGQDSDQFQDRRKSRSDRSGPPDCSNSLDRSDEPGTNPGGVVKKWRKMRFFEGQKAPFSVLGAWLSNHKSPIWLLLCRTTFLAPGSKKNGGRHFRARTSFDED